jgi:hypothetical protein
MAMTTIQKVVITATLVAVAGTGIYEARRASVLQETLVALQQEHATANEQIQRLQSERDATTAALAAAEDENDPAPGVPSELLKLRAEIARLRSEAQAQAQARPAVENDTTSSVAKSWLTRVDQLKKRAAATQEIPELQLVGDKDWLDAVKDATQLESDVEIRQALSRLRSSAKNHFGSLTREALKKYVQASDGLLPENWSQLQPYFEPPMDESILQRYELLQTGKLADVPRGEFLFSENAPPADQEYDVRFQFRMDGTRSTTVNPNNSAVQVQKVLGTSSNGR